MRTEVAKKSNGAALRSATFGAIEKVLISGDLAPLTAEQRVEYYNAVCKAVGLNPLTKPFDYIQLNGKLALYANKGCAEQLRANRSISISVKDAKQVGDVYLVVVEASDDKGRIDSSTGAVSIKGLIGDALANAFMKCETKAKRRVTLSICGLNMLDETETETETIPNAIPAQVQIQEPRPVSKGPSAQGIGPTIAEPKKSDDAKKAAEKLELAQKILRAQKSLALSNDELQEWVTNMSGKTSLKELTASEMQKLLGELENEIRRK